MKRFNNDFNRRDTGAVSIKMVLVVLLAVILSSGATYLLVRPSGNGDVPEQASGERKVLFYRNPMNPAITSPVPAKDEMGMDYIPVYEDEGKVPKKSMEEEVEDFFAEDSDEQGSGVPGMAPITISPRGLQVAGVVTAPAVREPFTSEIRTVGRVLPDETRVRRVQTRVSGWVEKLHANFTGQRIEKGDPVLSIYSPELLSSQEEFLQAIKAAERLSASSDPETRKFGEDLRESARRRLKLFDVPESFIKRLEKEKTVERDITLVAPVTGFVTGKDVFEGQRVEPGMELFVITDLSPIWVEADFYEYEAGNLNVGQEATVVSSYDPNLRLTGTVSYIYPYLDPETRTIRARLEFENEGLVLKPGMFVDVTLETDLGETVVIPESAVLDTGVRKVVFVDLGEGRFDPREVRTGPKSGGRVQVLSGVRAGEAVVVKANFLLDSESRLQAIIQGMGQGSGGGHQHGGGTQ